jgi:4'-phosphopantetheinyl transferase
VTYIPTSMPALSSQALSGSEPAQHAWHPPPNRPRLAEGVIDVWRAQLATVPEDLCSLLSHEERERAQRIISVRSRTRWTRSRAVLRALLALYLDMEPAAVRLATGAHGKPALAGPPGQDSTAQRTSSSAGAAPMQFNLSHSRDIALYAITSGAAVGIDVELDRRAIDEVAIAAHVLGADEAERLRGLRPSERRREFLRAWVRHEARLKCLGVGVGAGEAGAIEDRSVSWIAELDIEADGAGAVAAEAPPRQLRCWHWLGH